MKVRSVKFNFVMNFILTASSFVFPLITYPYISRVLLVDINGKISFAVSVLSYFSMFASLGIPTYGIRACARVRDNKIELTRTVHELLIINLISTAVTYAAFFLSLIAIPVLAQDKELMLINSVSLILNTIGVSWFYSALELYSYITVRSLIFKSLSIVLMFVFVQHQGDYLIYAAITVLATGGSNIMNFINLRHYIWFKPIGNYNIQKHLKPIFFFFGSAVAGSIYTNLDLVMLRFLTNETLVGYYQVAVKIKTMLITVVTSLGAVMIPRLSYYVQQKKEAEFKNMIIKAFNFVLIAAFSIAIYFIIFAREAVLLLSGPAFLNAVVPLRVIMPSVVFIGFTYVTGLQIMIPLLKEKEMLISFIIASIVDFTMNLILIPRWKAIGAAFSNSFAEFSVLVVQCIFLAPLLKTIVGRFSLKKTGLALLGSSVTAIILRYLLITYLRAGSFMILAVTAIVYFGLGFVLLLLLKEPFVCDTLLPTVKKILKAINPNKS